MSCRVVSCRVVLCRVLSSMHGRDALVSPKRLLWPIDALLIVSKHDDEEGGGLCNEAIFCATLFFAVLVPRRKKDPLKNLSYYIFVRALDTCAKALLASQQRTFVRHPSQATERQYGADIDRRGTHMCGFLAWFYEIL